MRVEPSGEACGRTVLPVPTVYVALANSEKNNMKYTQIQGRPWHQLYQLFINYLPTIFAGRRPAKIEKISGRLPAILPF